MQEEHPLAKSPRRGWRRAKLLAGTLALTLAGFGSVAAVNALPASAASACGSAAGAPGCVTNTYTIGSPSGGVNSVTVTPTTGTTGVSVSYTITFVAVNVLATGNTITIGDSLSNAVVSTITPSTVALISGTCLQSGTIGTTVGTPTSPAPLVITLNSSACPSIAAGSTVTVTFNAGGVGPPAEPSGNFNYTVATSTNSTTVNSPTVVVSSAPPTLSASNQVAGQSSTFTITGAGAANANGGSWSTLTGTAGVLVLSSTGSTVTWAPGAASYTVTYTPSGGTAATDAVTAVQRSLRDGSRPDERGTDTDDAHRLRWHGQHNRQRDQPRRSWWLDSCDDRTVTNGSPPAAVGNTETTNTLAFGSAVKNVTLAISPTVAGATAEYTVGFTASSTTASGATTITFAEKNTTFTTVTGILVTDTTGGWHIVYNPTPAGSFTGTIPNTAFGTNVIKLGDAVTVTLAGVTNPGTGTYTDFAVKTSTDAVAANAPSYTITAAGTSGVNVIVNPPTVGSLATYTITGLFAASAITGSLTATAGAAGLITLTAPAGTVFPSSGGAYVITDSTTPSGSGTVGPNGVIPGSGGSNTVTFSPPNAIAKGDVLTITVMTVINPSTPSSGYQLTIFGPVTAATGVGTFPHANVTFPNSALINFAGTIYVFAGGHAFGIPTPTVLNKIRAVNPAVVLNAVAGTVVPVQAARPGTLISTYAVNGNATIYVVGTDGELHGFSTPKQYKANGYDTAINTTVNTTGGMTIGSTIGVLGANGNALATSSDGAIVDSSGTFYTFGGGRALGIPTPARLALVQMHNTATVLTGTVSTTQKQASLASGVLLSVASTTGGVSHRLCELQRQRIPVQDVEPVEERRLRRYAGCPSPERGWAARRAYVHRFLIIGTSVDLHLKVDER